MGRAKGRKEAEKGNLGSTTQKWLKKIPVLSVVFWSQIQHRALEATMKKFSPIPAKTSKDDSPWGTAYPICVLKPVPCSPFADDVFFGVNFSLGNS